MGHEWEGEGHGDRKRARGNECRRVACQKVFSTFKCCSGCGFLSVYGVLDNEGQGVMFLLTLLRLWRYLVVCIR